MSKNRLTIGLVGNPNCGKSTVFNALTGSSQGVGNWPGVTVERKNGFFSFDNNTVEVVDLPGVYSLTVASNESAIDERIACDFVLNQRPDLIVNIVDASNLERHLYLTLQLIELGVPIVLGLNRMDLVQGKGLKIDIEALAKKLDCIIVPLVARKGEGIEELKRVITQVDPSKKIVKATEWIPAEIKIDDISIPLLEGNVLVAAKSSPELLSKAKEIQEKILSRLGEDADILIADARYRFIQHLMQLCTMKLFEPVTSITTRIDSILLNRVLGLPIFLAVMYLLFFFAIKGGGFFQDYFDNASNLIFVEGFKDLLKFLHSPGWLIAILANGIGKGINTIITFIPVITAMFLGLAFLEDSGYMSRAAFVIDRLMRMLGLPGKSFVPMIVGFGCNVPAVMAARTLENQRDRILTVLMTPFMSCSARLTVYAVFTAAFFPSNGQNVVFGLYLMGILMAVFTGWILRKTILKGNAAPLVMELPSYHLPKRNMLLRHAWQRLEGFVFRAGKLILPICILLGVLNAWNMDGSLNSGESNIHSVLATLGKWLTPIFTPMGIQSDNWPATVGLVTGILAKEVVVGSLNSLYSQMSQVNQPIYSVMIQQFGGTINAMAYLLFALLYFPCVSTVAVMWREIGRYWACFSVVWTTGLAYVVSVIFYQLATFLDHPFISCAWVSVVGCLFLLLIILLSLFAKRGHDGFASH